MDGTRRNAEKLTAIRGADTNGRPPDAVPDVLRRSALPQQSAAPRPVRALRHINGSDSLVGAKFPSTSGLNWNASPSSSRSATSLNPFEIRAQLECRFPGNGCLRSRSRHVFGCVSSVSEMTFSFDTSQRKPRRQTVFSRFDILALRRPRAARCVVGSRESIAQRVRSEPGTAETRPPTLPGRTCLSAPYPTFPSIGNSSRVRKDADAGKG